MSIPEITVTEAQTRLLAGDATFLDIRDFGSYTRAHIPGAVHIGDHNIDEFIASSDKTRAVVVYCYHGNSSRGGTAHLLSHGFQEVYSMSGGFTSWPESPIEVGLPNTPTEQPSSTAEAEAPEERATPRPASRRRRLANRVKALFKG